MVAGYYQFGMRKMEHINAYMHKPNETTLPPIPPTQASVHSYLLGLGRSNVRHEELFFSR